MTPNVSSYEKNEETIHNTPITWNLIEKDFQNAFRTKAKIGESRSARRIGNGMGYISQILLANFDWVNDEESQLPKTAVLKITIAVERKPSKFGAEGPQKFDMKELHNTELKFYKRSIDPLQIPETLMLPKFYCGRFYGEEGLNAGYIAMEHIEEAVDRHIYQNVDQIGLLEALEQLIELAVFSINNPNKLNDWPKIGKTLFDHFLAADNVQEKLATRCELFPVFKSESNILRKYFDKVWGDYRKFTERRENTCKVPILCQGDIWTPNILWKIDENGIHHVRAFIDWQLVHIGSPLEDLVFLFHSALSGKDYKEKINFYLHHYYNTLKRRLEMTEKRMPWENFEEFKEQYEIAYVYMLGILWRISLMILEEEIEKDATFMNGDGATLVGKTLFQARETNRILEKYFEE